MSTRTPGPLGIAVIGAGYWGPNLVRNFQASPNFRLRWLCDLDVERARRVLGGYSTVQVAADLDEVLADPAKRKALVAEIERYAMGEKAWMFPVIWWYRIIPYLSKVRGYRVGSNHYTTMDMANIWIADK